MCGFESAAYTICLLANMSLSRGVSIVPRPDLCYHPIMAPKKPSSKKGKASGFVIGSVRFRKISAVEGIVYSPKMKGSAAIGKSSKALTPEERRKAIIKAYRKA